MTDISADLAHFNNIRAARRVLIQAWVDDPDFKRGYIDNAAMALHDLQVQFTADGLSFDMRDKYTRDKAALFVLDWLFNPKELDEPEPGIPLSPVGKKRRLLEVGERFFHRKVRRSGVVLRVTKNQHQPLAQVQYDGDEDKTIVALADLEEIPPRASP